MKIDKKPGWDSCNLKIGYQLCLMHSQKAFYCFHLDDELVLNKDVQTESAVEVKSLVLDGLGDLALKG